MTPQSAPHLSTPARTGRTIVVGLGRTGMSCARFLHARGIDFAVTDSRAAPPESQALQQLAPGVEMRFGGFDQSLLDGAEQVIASPGVSLDEPFLKAAAARGIAIVGDIELFVREAKAPIAAITGTNGKSTVTTLVALMANAAGKHAIAAGNLGTPVLDLLEAPAPHIYVLELSSFQLDTTHSLRAAVATVLNVTPDHMDRYGSLEAYADSKARIFDGAKTAVLNLDDAAVRAMAPKVAKRIGFSLVRDPAADYCAEQSGNDTVLTCRGERLVAMSELKIAGLHNAANALAALAMCEALGLPRDPCIAALREFTGLPHRSQFVAEIGGVRYVDDSKGTNVGATLAAVAGMPGSLVVIAGGQGKGQDFAPLAEAFRGKVRHVVLIGQDAKLIDEALRGTCTTEFAADMDAAVKAAANAARAGETVLLSPACASLDMFRDYGHRGDVFAACVRGLAA
jgi:UDP-N-acetylmuramoylalanine--D-glutamate ligase